MRTRINLPLLTLLMASLIMVFSCKPREETEAVAEAPEESSRLYDISANEEANIQMAKDFVIAVLSGDHEKARSFAHSEYYDFGPGSKDSLSLDEFLAAWETTTAARTDQDPGIMIGTALTVNEGDLAGDWVNLWGSYTAKQGDYEFNVPWHRVFLVQDGKFVMSRSWFDRLSSGLEMGVYQMVETE